jgi:ketosteroid isomerase-like protein
MSEGQPTVLRKWLAGALVPAAAVVVALAPGIARAGSGDGAGAVGDRDPMVAEAMRMDEAAVVLWKERRWDEFAATYAPDAIAVPPNHEPIRGGKAIAGYYQSLRDAVGELEGGTETFRAEAGGNLVSLVAKYSGRSGQVRFTAHELYERQPDGSLKLAVDMVGLRDPLR